LPDPQRQRAGLQRRVRKWRFLSLGSGMLLTASFFMPAIQACNGPAVPARCAYEVVGDPWINWPLAFCWFVAAYLLGFLIAVAALCRMIDRRWGIAITHRSIPLLLLFVAIYVPFFALKEMWNNRAGSGVNHWPSIGELWAGKWELLIWFLLPIM